MSEQLKSCPFCGSKAAVCVEPFSTTQWVECDDCGAEGQTCDSREDAVAAWNSRTQEWIAKFHQLRRDYADWVFRYAMSDGKLNKEQIKQFDAALAALKAHVLGPAETGGTEWRPIETAPLDGTPVVLLGVIACDRSGKNRGKIRSCVSRYAATKDEGPGYFEGWAFVAPGIVDRMEPSHWMPLPQPPASVVHSQSAGQDTP